MVARRRGRTEYLSYLQWLLQMPRHGNGPKELQSSPCRLVVGPLHEALSQASVTNRSVYPQELVTAVLKDGAPKGRVVLAVLDFLASCFLVPNIPAT